MNYFTIISATILSLTTLTIAPSHRNGYSSKQLIFMRQRIIQLRLEEAQALHSFNNKWEATLQGISIEEYLQSSEYKKLCKQLTQQLNHLKSSPQATQITAKIAFEAARTNALLTRTMNYS